MTTSTPQALTSTITSSANTTLIVEITSEDDDWGASAWDSVPGYGNSSSIIDCSDLDGQSGNIEDLCASATVIEALATPLAAQSEIYDSGATRHMSPFHEDF